MTDTGETPDREQPEPWLAGPPPPPPGSDPSGPGQSSTSGPTGAGGSNPGSSDSAGTAWSSTLSGAKEGMIGGLSVLHNGSVWLLGAGAILVAFIITWMANVIEAFRHGPGIDSQYRIMQFFSPGSIDWGVGILLAVALLAVGRHLDPPKSEGAGHHSLITLAAFLAAGAVAASAVIDVLVELTNFGNGIDDALAGLISYLAVIPLGLVAAWWAFLIRDPAEKKKQ